MRSRCVIVGKVGARKTLKMKCVEDDGMIEALATNRSDGPLNVRILPR